MFSEILLVSALLFGQPVHAQHEFGSHYACLRIGAFIWNELKSKGAEDIIIHCYEEPAT